MLGANQIMFLHIIKARGKCYACGRCCRKSTRPFAASKYQPYWQIKPLMSSNPSMWEPSEKQSSNRNLNCSSCNCWYSLVQKGWAKFVLFSFFYRYSIPFSFFFCDFVSNYLFICADCFWLLWRGQCLVSERLLLIYKSKLKSFLFDLFGSIFVKNGSLWIFCSFFLQKAQRSGFTFQF